MRRRTYLALAGLTATGTLTGCSGGDDSGGNGNTSPDNETANGDNSRDGGNETDSTRFSGCPEPPAPETDPASLLPDAPTGWEQTSTSGEAAGIVGAEVGITGVYTNPDGQEYSVELLRWPSSEEAQDGALIYRNSKTTGERYQLWLALGRFTFAVYGLQLSPARALLTASPTLSQNCIEQKTTSGTE
jgi:hypothetical protein